MSITHSRKWKIKYLYGLPQLEERNDARQNELPVFLDAGLLRYEEHARQQEGNHVGSQALLEQRRQDTLLRHTLGEFLYHLGQS